MKSISIKKLYGIHSWVGLITGILLFVIAFTGAVSVFARPEIKIWANPEIRAPITIDHQRIEQLIAEYAPLVPEAYREEIMIFLPRTRAFAHLNIVFEAHSDEGGAKGILYAFSPTTYELKYRNEGSIEQLFAQRPTDMADFIADFHADLHLGRPVGLLLTGILGLTLMASIVTGIIIHRKILAQLFTFRPSKSFSLMLNDGHKVFGVWGVAFHSLIAFTGAFLGLATVLLVPAAAFVSFGGDQDKLIETFTAMPEPVLTEQHQATQIATSLDNAMLYHKDSHVVSATVMAYGDKNAVIYVSTVGGPQVSSLIHSFNSSGEPQASYGALSRIEGFSGKILDLLFPLHFGNFGGLLVKFIWAILGLTTALLPLTGLMLWLERGINSPSPKFSLQTYHRFNRLVMGCCAGVVFATILLFPAQLILARVLNSEYLGNPLGWVFFSSWGLSICWTLWMPDMRKATRQLLYAIAISLLLIMPLNILLTGSHIFALFTQQHYVSLSIDLLTFVLGLWGIYQLRKTQTPKTVEQNNPETQLQELES